jgi:hypothetical protein
LKNFNRKIHKSTDKITPYQIQPFKALLAVFRWFFMQFVI